MKARLFAVQQALFLLLIASIACGLVTRPYPANRRFMDALDEMTTFRDGFKQAELEKSLLDFARAQGAVPMAAVAAAARGRGVPSVVAAKAAPALQPTAAVQLQTLSDVQFRAQADSSLEIGVPKADAMGAAIAWRLARNPDAGTDRYTLTGIELVPAVVTQADVDLEVEVARLRTDELDAQVAVDEATKKLEAAETLFETRRKWKLPWKILVKSDDARKEARATLETDQHQLKTTQRRYESQAKLAQKPKQPSAAALGATFAVAKVGLDHNATHITLELPVALELRKAPVPTLRGGEFAAAHKAGLWDEVKGLDAAHALDAIRSHFNWHYRYVSVAGMRVGGMTLLQLLPCLLPVLLLLFVLRMRAVSTSYNPFGTTIDSTLPSVGLKSRALEAVALVILPFAAAGSAASALLFIGQVPALPVLTAIACLGLGLYAFSKLGELQTLIEAVVRSHSNPPPKEEPVRAEEK